MYSMNVDDGVVLMNVEYYERAVVEGSLLKWYLILIQKNPTNIIIPSLTYVLKFLLIACLPYHK